MNYLSDSLGRNADGRHISRGCDSDFLSPALQVRCAAVFALGTFVGNSAERTDHSTTIDHNVAMMLAQLINDGSPMVRKVCMWCQLSSQSEGLWLSLCGCPYVPGAEPAQGLMSHLRASFDLNCLLAPHRVFIAHICSLEGAELTGFTDFHHRHSHAWAWAHVAKGQ